MDQLQRIVAKPKDGDGLGEWRGKDRDLLFAAIDAGDPDEVAHLLTRTPNHRKMAGLKDFVRGHTPLTLAAQKGDAACLKALIEHGEARFDRSRVALKIATAGEHDECERVLVKHLAKIAPENSAANRVLAKAAQAAQANSEGAVRARAQTLRGTTDAFKADQAALFEAVRQGDSERVAELLQIDRRHARLAPLADLRQKGLSPLVLAAQLGRAECLRSLLAHGAVQASGVREALLIAADRGRTECALALVDHLLAAKADPGYIGHAFERALNAARDKNRKPCMAALLAHPGVFDAIRALTPRQPRRSVRAKQASEAAQVLAEPSAPEPSSAASVDALVAPTDAFEAPTESPVAPD